MAGAYIQSWRASTDGSATITVTVSGATANNLLFATVSNRAQRTYTHPSDWVLIKDGSDKTINSYSIYYRVATGTTSDNFTPVISSGNRMYAAVSEFSGLDSASPFEAFAVDETEIGNASATSTGTGSATAVAANGIAIVAEIVYAWEEWNAGTTLTNGAVHDLRTSGSTARPGQLHGSFNYTSAGSKSDTFSTTDTGGECVGVIAVFKEAGGASAAIPHDMYYKTLLSGDHV